MLSQVFLEFIQLFQSSKTIFRRIGSVVVASHLYPTRYMARNLCYVTKCEGQLFKSAIRHHSFAASPSHRLHFCYIEIFVENVDNAVGAMCFC